MAAGIAKRWPERDGWLSDLCEALHF